MHVSGYIIAGLALASLTACGSNGTGAPTTGQAPTTINTTGHTEVDATRFTDALQAQYPALAQGRTAKGIGHDVDATCAEAHQGVDPLVIQQHIIGRFARPDTTPSPAQAAALLALMRATACP